MTSGDISDYSEAEQDAPMLIPAAPIKPGKKKAGGLGKKGKVFASKSKMLELVDRVNAVQEQKLGLLIERDVELSKRLAQREASKKFRQESKKNKLENVKDLIKSGKPTGRPGKKGAYSNDDDEREEKPGRKGQKGGAHKGKGGPKGSKGPKGGKKPSSGGGGKGPKSNGKGKKKVSFK